MGLNRKVTQSYAYMAGVFDGEGHVSIHKSKTSYACHAVVGMSDPEAVLMLADAFGGNVCLQQPHHTSVKTAKPIYRVYFAGYKGYEFLKAMKSYSLVKNRQIRIALAFLSHRRRNHWKKNGNVTGECATCERYVLTIRAVRKESKGVNSVNALLKHGMREYRAKRADVAAFITDGVKKVEKMLEGVETSVEASTANKTISAPEQEIVQAA